MAFRSYKEASKTDWGTTDETKDIPEKIGLSLEQIKLGCLLRIADATELMSTNYLRMQSNLDWYKDYYIKQTAEIEKLRRSLASYKGQITKLKNKKS